MRVERLRMDQRCTRATRAKLHKQAHRSERGEQAMTCTDLLPWMVRCGAPGYVRAICFPAVHWKLAAQRAACDDRAFPPAGPLAACVDTKADEATHHDFSAGGGRCRFCRACAPTTTPCRVLRVLLSTGVDVCEPEPRHVHAVACSACDDDGFIIDAQGAIVPCRSCRRRG